MQSDPDLDSELPYKSDPDQDQEIIFSDPTHCNSKDVYKFF